MCQIGAPLSMFVSGKFVGDAKIMGDRLLSENPKLRNNSECIGKIFNDFAAGWARKHFGMRNGIIDHVYFNSVHIRIYSLIIEIAQNDSDRAEQVLYCVLISFDWDII